MQLLQKYTDREQKTQSQETNLPLKPHSENTKIVELFLWKNAKEMI